MPIRLIAALAGLLAIVLLVKSVLQAQYDRGRSDCEAQHTAVAQREALRRLEAQAGNAARTRRAAERDRAAAAGVDAAAAGLRDALIERDRGASAPAVPGVAPAASEPDLRSDVLGEIEARLRGLAREADARGTAGTGCEREYGALNEGR